jgi:hypothetical protein
VNRSRDQSHGHGATETLRVKPGPTKPASAIQISDADRKRKILITDKCTMARKKWREKGESLRVDRYRRIEGRKRLSVSRYSTEPLNPTHCQ